MRMLRRLRNDAILLVVICAASYVAYQVLLDDEAKQGVKSMVRTVGDSYQQLSNLVNDHIGTIMDEDVVSQNKTQIMNAWADLGF
ncbi:MAG: hypothetical protein IJ781_09135 [Atopobiaceae bacterium]|nr:hypothetical protein [Atopobiaceae bacterium]